MVPGDSKRIAPHLNKSVLDIPRSYPMIRYSCQEKRRAPLHHLFEQFGTISEGLEVRMYKDVFKSLMRDDRSADEHSFVKVTE